MAPVVKLAVKYGFNLLGLGVSAGDEIDLGSTALMELFTTGKMTLDLFKVIEPLLKAASLPLIKKFREELAAKGVSIPASVGKAFDVIVSDML